MEKLADSYRKNSYDFKLIDRTGDVAIYEQREPSNNRLLGYEVFVVQKQAAGMLLGRPVEEKEITPSNSEWGQLGFTTATLQAAYDRQAELLGRLAARS